MQKLYFETVSPILKSILLRLMSETLFNRFRLVGGTNLSLRAGHRISEDIDLFTDAIYGTIDFSEIEKWLESEFSYFETPYRTGVIGAGRSYYVGYSKNQSIKLDLMYTDTFIYDFEAIDGIRMANIKDIIAMKLNVILYGGRKKDFWDIHYLLDKYPLRQMIDIHAERHPWEHDIEVLLRQLLYFEKADKDFDPKCLLLKNWDDIKLDIIDETLKIKESLRE